MKLLPALALAALALVNPAFAEPTPAAAVTETRAIGEFQAVAVRGPIDLQVRQGEPASVQVIARPEVLPLIETVVEGSGARTTLQLRFKRGNWTALTGRAQVRVVMPRLSALSGAGNGEIRLEAFTTPALKLTLAGNGDARLSDLNTEELALTLSGSADVKASGKATRATVSISGSGDVDLDALRAEEMSVRIAGSGDAVVQAHKTLAVRIAGSGNVAYRGGAAVTSSVAGSGAVRKR